MNKLLNTSSITGSAWVPTALRRLSFCTRRSTRWFLAVSSACQPCSTTTVWCGSLAMGGPLNLVSRRQRLADIDERAVPFAVGEKARAARRRGQLAAFGFQRPLVELRATADRL